ncbi:MAG TPA: hypothetical protein VGN39_06205 [Terriglobales bacterium]|jgi:hypothetical protein|nr:hypothetical protein [Terriglobales bacterium]
MQTTRAGDAVLPGMTCCVKGKGASFDYIHPIPKQEAKLCQFAIAFGGINMY